MKNHYGGILDKVIWETPKLDKYFDLSTLPMLRGVSKGLCDVVTHVIDNKTSLDLSNKNLGSDPAKIQLLADQLHKMGNLTSLNISRNNITAAGISILSHSLKHLTKLTSLNLSENIITVDCRAAVGPKKQLKL